MATLPEVVIFTGYENRIWTHTAWVSTQLGHVLAVSSSLSSSVSVSLSFILSNRPTSRIWCEEAVRWCTWSPLPSASISISAKVVLPTSGFVLVIYVDITKCPNWVAETTEIDCPAVMEARSQGVGRVSPFWGLWHRICSMPFLQFLLVCWKSATLLAL